MTTLTEGERRALEKRFRTPGAIAWPTIALSIFVGAAFAASCALAVRGMLPVAAAVPLNTILAYLAFTGAHEAGHGNIAGGVRGARGVESLIGWTMTAILALPYPGLSYLHLQHHSNTNDPERDPDFHVSGNTVLRVLIACMTIQVGYSRVLRRLLAGGSKGAQDALRASRPFYVASLALLLAAIYYDFWLWLLLLWYVPATLGLGLLALVFDWLPHHPHDNRERYRDTRIQLGAGLNRLLLGQCYHLIHHLYPRVPFYAYARCFRAVRPVLELENARIEYPFSPSRTGSAHADGPAADQLPRG